MAMKPILKQTGREKLGYIDGVNLFFGALLGANLGTLGAMPLSDYVVLIALLVGLVMAIRSVSLSDRRLYALAMLASCLAVFAVFLFMPGVQLEGLGRSDLERLAATILVWVAVTMTVEFYPTSKGEDQAGT